MEESAASRTRLWVYYDVAVATISAALGFYLTPFFHELPFSSHGQLTVIVPMYGFAFAIVSLAIGTYDLASFQSLSRAVMRVSIAAIAAWSLVLLLHHFLSYHLVGRWIISISALTVTFLAVLPRAMLSLVLARSPHRVLVAGGEWVANIVKCEFEAEPRQNMIFVGSFPACMPLSVSPPPGTISDLHQACNELQVDTLLVAEDSAKGVADQVPTCRGNGIRVVDLASFIEETFGKVPIETIRPAWVIDADMKQTLPLSALAKRGSDVLLAAVGLAVTLPFWPLIALAIKLSSRGPVFYSQERVSQLAQGNFRLYKFRTMRVDAESNGEAVWASKNDPRVTLVGRILRRIRIDELPQLVNVLRGDMSFIGPRPERPEFVEKLVKTIPHYHLRHLVRPGITGWAQIRYRYGASEDDAAEKLRYDLYYVKHGSLALDLRIVLQTCGAVFRGSR